MTTKLKLKKPEVRFTGLMLTQDDYSQVYRVSVKTIKQWHARGYDLDDPPLVWKHVFSHQTWPANFPTAKNDCGSSWNKRWLEVAEKRGVIE